MKSFLRGAVVAIASTLLISGAVAQQFQGPEFEAAVEAYIKANPKVVIDAVNGYVEDQRLAERQKQDQQFLGAADAFMDETGLPVLGNRDGSVTMVYVIDAACGYCRQMTPIVEKLMEDNPDLKIVQRWVPFLTPASEYAARLAFLINERFPDKYSAFYTTMMSRTGQLDNQVVDAVVAEVLGDEQMQVLRTDATDGTTSLGLASRVQQNLDLASAAGVNGTPFYYVEDSGADGIIRGSSPIQVVQAAIDRAKATVAN